MTQAGTHRDLGQWLDWLATLTPNEIQLGLDRVSQVLERLQPKRPELVLHVAGTNGKGSCVHMLEMFLRRRALSVGCYTSPHLQRYNERIRIDGVDCSDGDIVAAFERVESARRGVPLTYFEFGTLAAVWLFVEARVDVAILEVGLGGRLDAVNAFDADCALVMSVALDHMDYLGDTREAIGYEKAGIFRAGRPAICGDPAPPQSLLQHAREIGAQLLVRGVDFDYAAEHAQWRYRGPHGSRYGLPHPVLLLIHGGPGSWDHTYFKPDFAPLTEQAQVVYLDLRGHGRSERPDAGTFGFEACADDIAAFCDIVGIAGPIVLGHSMGAPIVLLYGSRHPGHAGGLIVQSGFARFDIPRLVEGFRRVAGDEVAEIAGRSYRGQEVPDEEWARVSAAFGPRVPDRDQAARPRKNLELNAPGMELVRRTDILDQLVRPGRDPRADLPAPILRSDVLAMDDLLRGMRLKGTVRNVVDFGAFVDIGVKQDGLLHKSQVPRGARLSVGDVIDVEVLSVEPERGRVGLGLAPVEE